MKASCEAWLKEQFGDDRETIETVYAEYVETMAGLAKELAAARASGDPKTLDRVLHTIKGSAGMAGDAELSELANKSRTAGNEAMLDEVARMLADLTERN